MGWWEAENGDTLGDGPLNVLEEWEAENGSLAANALPAGIADAITREYREGLGRPPTASELTSLLAFHHGDAGLGVIPRIVGPRSPENDG